MRKKTLFKLLILSLLLASFPAAAETLPDPKLFPVPENLKPNVAFWGLVYGHYSSQQRLLHDREHLEIVYTVLDFARLESSQTSESRKTKIRRLEIQKAEKKYRDLLRRLEKGEDTRGKADLERLVRLFRKVPGGNAKYREAMQRFRTQRGQKDRFAEGIIRSGAYLPEIEETFRKRGVPVEMSRIAFVESMFQLQAHSSAQALGIWQFVSSTGRQYLTIGNETDDRLDPLLASDAAARMLRDNFDRLGTWPLAITAYNYGPNGLSRAVAKLGTRDLGEIVARHRTSLFGFASKNFYAEFVAAARTYARRNELFPQAVPDAPWTFDVFTPDRFVDLPELAQAASTDLASLRRLNPGLRELLWKGDLLHPKNRSLRIPSGRESSFRAAYSSLPQTAVADRQAGLYYVVRKGDTLGAIARRHGTSVSSLQRANSLSSPNRLRVGQRLFVASGGRGLPPETTHTVKKGENLTRIAALYGTSAEQLQKVNGLSSAHHIRPGQSLRIHGGRATTHVVQAGETLAAIATRYRTTVQALRSANRIAGHLIHPHQILVIP